MHTYPQRACLDGLGSELFKLVSYGATREEWEEWLRVPMEYAAARGDLGLVNKLLEAGADGSAGWIGSRGRTLLDAAAQGGNADVVSTLIRAGAGPDVNTVSAYTRRSALYVAAKCGHEDAGSVLILAGADVLVWDPADRRNVISEAARGGHTKLVRDMLMAGAHADEYLYENPLHLAVSSGSESVVEALILAGANPNIVDHDGNTPLICAADLGRTSMVKMLLAAGADTSQRAHDGRNALHTAARSGEVEIVSELLNEGVDMNVCDETRATPLLSAVKAAESSAAKPLLPAKALKAAEALLVAGADIRKRDLSGRSALDWAATNANADMLKLLLRHGAEANDCDLLGRTALHRVAVSDASIADTEDAIKALINGGADTEFPNEQGCTPLSDATRRFDCKNMRALLLNGAKPNARGLNGNTPLHEACMRRFGNLETVVDLLLRWGADEKARNDDELLPEDTLDSGDSVVFCGEETITRTRRLLTLAENDRTWRRRGWLVVLRSRELQASSVNNNHNGGDGGGDGDGEEHREVDEAERPERLRRRTINREPAGDRGRCGSDARNAATAFSLMKTLPKISDDVFRAVVSFL
eukprot:g7129.t1